MRSKQHLIPCESLQNRQELMLPDPSSPLCRVPGPVDLEPRRARDNDPIYYTTDEKNDRADYQRHVEAAYCDGLYKGSERNSQEKRAVVLRSTAPRLAGKSLVRPDCCAGKNNWATAALNPTARSMRVPKRKARKSKKKQIQSPARLTSVVNFGPSRSARRPPIKVPAIAPHHKP